MDISGRSASRRVRPLRLGDLGGGIAQRWADLLDLDLDLVDGSLLAFLGLARPLPVLAVAGLAEAEAATPAVVHDAEGRERPAGAAR